MVADGAHSRGYASSRFSKAVTRWAKILHWTMKHEVGAFEAENNLGTLLDRVERGEEIVITRHGKPIARLVPNSGRIDTFQARAAADRIRERARHVKAVFDWNSLKADRDRGRP